MEAAQLNADSDSGFPQRRLRRPMALISASVIAMTTAGIVFLHPALPSFGGGAVPAVPQTSYRVTAVDFVDGATGWVVVILDALDFAVLHTGDGGRSWDRRLSGPTEGRAQYLKFFDRNAGVFALAGTRPLLYRTRDGGRTWSALPALKTAGSVLSWSFVDPQHGWMLVDEGSPTLPAATTLYRTGDGGRSWRNLGHPVDAPDRAFRVDFSNLATGWLASSGAGPYALRTDDLGATWSRVTLPPPQGGWPQSGQFFVAVQSTSGRGAVASVVYLPQITTKKGTSGTIRAFPPLTVRVYDGGRPVLYTYTTLIDQVAGGPVAQQQAPNQTRLSTLDGGTTWTRIDPPSTSGAIGYFDALNWWWIGSGSWARSRDGGISWTIPRGIGVTEPMPGTLRVLDRNHAWFAGAAGTTPVLEGTDDGGLHWRRVVLPAT